MRRILVENARRKRRLKRGGDHQRIDMEEVAIVVDGPTDDLIALDDALNKLAETQPQKAELVKLRYFAGMTIDEAAIALGVSSSTVDRDWTYCPRLALSRDGRRWRLVTRVRDRRSIR
jgi:RNA polymerase sigma factor (TIGR02999 family)